MKKDEFFTASRRTTAWTGKEDAEPQQSYSDGVMAAGYESKHRRIRDSGSEIEFLNAIQPDACPYCGSHGIMRYGRTSVGISKYKCRSCNRYFCITTGTIFQDHKIPISEWIECCLALFRLQSFNAISKSNRNSYTTTKYWISKIGLILKGYQDHVVLSGKVYRRNLLQGQERRHRIQWRRQGIEGAVPQPDVHRCRL